LIFEVIHISGWKIKTAAVVARKRTRRSRIPTEEWAISLSLGHDGLRDNSSKASIDYLVVAVRTFITKILFPKLLKSTVKRAASTKKSSLRSRV